MTFDVAIVGGGPVGLVTALELHARGLRVVVFERRGGDVDKACGEGLMPQGTAALRRLGAMQYLTPADCAPFTAIRYIQEDGRGVQAPLPAPGGLGVRRTALRSALLRAARDQGIDVRDDCAVRSHDIGASDVLLATDAGTVRARFLVAADGLHSPIRRSLGLERERASGEPQRFGVRRHVAMAPWAPCVEVHWNAGVEAYVTPTGNNRVGLGFLWERDALAGAVDFDALLARFPALERRFAGAPADSRAMGAGPLLQRVVARTARRAALVGDAAGFVDGITGEGLSVGFAQARALAAVLPDALREGATVASLARYERASARVFRHAAVTAHGLLWLARRPRLRRFVFDRCIEAPVLFRLALRAAVAGD